MGIGRVGSVEGRGVPTVSIVLLVALALASCAGAPSPGRDASAARSTQTVDLAGAGNVTVCGSAHDHDVGRLVGNLGATVFAAGDISPSGALSQLTDCYGATWGWFKDRTRAVPGDQEWQTSGLSGYRAYWGPAVTDGAGHPWYAFDLGAWRVLMLDSDCEKIGGCGADSPEGKWLTAELDASNAVCTMAIWHHPRFTSGVHGNHRDLAWFWYALYRAGADVVVNAHDTDYERFAPQAPNATTDTAHGIREFVVGTGGAQLDPFGTPQANSEFRQDTAYGVIEFALRPTGYAWRFIAVGDDILDSGSSSCH